PLTRFAQGLQYGTANDRVTVPPKARFRERLVLSVVCLGPPHEEHFCGIENIVVWSTTSQPSGWGACGPPTGPPGGPAIGMPWGPGMGMPWGPGIGMPWGPGIPGAAPPGK